MKNSVKDLIISISSGVISSIIFKLICDNSVGNNLNIGLTILFALLISILVYLLQFVIKCKTLGIVKILNSSIKGEGATEAYMKRSTRSIYFVGIAASKWVNNADLLEKTIRTICSRNCGSIKFLLLNPDSDAAKKLNLPQNSPNEKSIKDKINISLNKLSEIANRVANSDDKILEKFEIRLYNQMPIYRLVIIDDNRAYFCFYQIGCDGSNLKQFVIKPKHSSESKQENIFNCMTEYFESLWNSKDTIKYNLVKEKTTDRSK